MAGAFLALEGPDGSGKSTMLDAVRRHLEVKGVEALFVRDPGGTGIGDAVRGILLDPQHAGMCGVTELLLYVACRAQLVAERIRPALERGVTVVADRFVFSTLAYQGVAGAVPERVLRQVADLGVGETRPDMTILLDLPAEAGLARAGRNPDRMELKGLQFHREVRQRYLGLAEGADADKVRVVDAARNLLEVKREVLEFADELLG